LLQGVQTPRPLTFAFAANLLAAAASSLRSVTITRLADRTFYATADIEGRAGRASVDARPSDAISLALAAATPVYIDPGVLSAAGIERANWDPLLPAAPGYGPQQVPYSIDAAGIVEEVTKAWMKPPEPAAGP
jgi:hypothetical protein